MTGDAAAALVLVWMRGAESPIDPEGSLSYRGWTVLLVGLVVLVEEPSGRRSGTGHGSEALADRAWRTLVLRQLNT
jgi:hypothetical protein